MILIAEFMDQRAVDRLSARHVTRYLPALADRQDDIADMMKGIRALVVRNRTKVTSGLLECAPELRIVGRLGTGLDNIDTAECEKRGIDVIPATGANSLSVAEYVVTNAMVLLRGAYGANARMLNGGWPRMDCAGREAAGKRLGLVGFGAIARQTAVMARAMGMSAAAFDPFVPPDDGAWTGVSALGLDELLESSDVVSLHVPLNSDTRHMIDTRALKRMKPDAILINAARGGVVDEGALCDALRSGRIGGAALDVFETEPLTAEAASRFSGLQNLVLTPHIAGVTVESNRRVSELIALRILDRLAGM